MKKDDSEDEGSNDADDDEAPTVEAPAKNVKYQKKRITGQIAPKAAVAAVGVTPAAKVVCVKPVKPKAKVAKPSESKESFLPPGVNVSNEASRGQVRVRIDGEPSVSFKGDVKTATPGIKKHVKSVFKRLGIPVPAAFV